MISRVYFLLITTTCVIFYIYCLPDHHWQQYKEKHGKSYGSGLMDARRRSHFELNRWRVDQHNAETENGTHSYNLTINHLADRLPHTLQNRRLTGLLKSPPSKSARGHATSEGPIPESLDWREKGFRTKGWSQGECGSCYALTMASVMEAQVFKHNGSLVELSRQQLVDCSVLTGNLGCSGGSFKNTARYLVMFGLLPSEEYPTAYSSKQSVCRGLQKYGLRADSWGTVPRGDEDALAETVARVGPLAVSLDATPHTFQLYHSGTYDDPTCSANRLNHAVLLVGYTPDSWIIRNWWGDDWGQRGYMSLRRGVNRCGIANYAIFLKLG